MMIVDELVQLNPGDVEFYFLVVNADQAFG